MKKYTSTPIKVSLLILLISILFSCTKDSDLLAEYITEENIELVEAADNPGQPDEQSPQDPPQDPPNDPSQGDFDIDMGELKAFPGAEGFGRYATGGRGGQVYHVTNLEDDGPGSFRYGCEDLKGPRTIVFDVGGDIFLNRRILLRASSGYGDGDITIAGETSPSPGITIRNFGLSINESNVIIRYLTFRLKDTRNDSNPMDVIEIRNNGSNGSHLENIILDHVTTSHGDDEVLSPKGNSVNQTTRKITIQNCMIGQSNHNYNTLVGKYTYELSFYKNYFHHTKDRSILFGYGVAQETAEMINNVIYGYKYGTTIAWGSIVDVIGNVYKPFSNVEGNYSVNYSANRYNNPTAKESDGDLFVSDNFNLSPSSTLHTSSVLNYTESSRVLKNSLINDWLKSSDEIVESVLSEVGNSIHRDLMDIEHINDFYSGTGDWSNPSIIGKTETQRSSNYDTDNDGMADDWEIGYYGTLSKDDQSDENGDGYTNIEEFFYYMTR